MSPKTTTIDDLIDGLESVRAKHGNCRVMLFDAGNCNYGDEGLYVNDDVVPVFCEDGSPDYTKAGEWICIVGAWFEETDFAADSDYDEWHERQLEMENC